MILAIRSPYSCLSAFSELKVFVILLVLKEISTHSVGSIRYLLGNSICPVGYGSKEYMSPVWPTARRRATNCEQRVAAGALAVPSERRRHARERSPFTTERNLLLLEPATSVKYMHP